MTEHTVTRFSTPSRYEGYSEARYDGWQRSSEYITVRDGTRLAIDIIRPALDGIAEEQALPVIWIATQYQRARYDEQRRILTAVDTDAALRHFCLHGYVIAVLDVRGTGASFGVKHGAETPHSPRHRWDLYDVATWIGQQRWCDGNIGMYGISFVAGTQFAAALTIPPYVKCIVPQQSVASSYRGYMNINGVQNKAFRGTVDATMRMLNVDRPAPPVDADRDGSLRDAAIEEHKAQMPSLPILLQLPFANSWSEFLNDAPGLRGVVSEWPLLAASGIAMYHWGGWPDLYPDETLKLYATFKDTNPSRLVMGPWFHTEQPSYKDAGFDYATELLRWYDFWLKGIRNGIDAEPPIRYYVENAPADRQWRTATSWPLPTTQNTRFYFEAGRSGTSTSVNDGRLVTTVPSAAAGTRDRYRVDYSTTTSNLFTRYPKVLSSTAPRVRRREQDWRDFDAKALTYTSEPLTRDTEIIGHPVVNLWIAADAPDADLFVYLEEVLPDDSSLWVTEGVMRASNRATGRSPLPNFGLPHHPSFSHQQQPLPGAGIPVQLEFAMLPVSRLCKRGNRIRISIVGYDKDNWDTPELPQPPTIELFRNVEHASYVTLPLIS